MESRGCLGGGEWGVHGLRSRRWDFISERTGETGGDLSSGYSEKLKVSLTEPFTSIKTFQPICYAISSTLITPPTYLSSLVPPPRFHCLLPYFLLKGAEVWCNWIQLVQKFQPERSTHMDQISGSRPKAETVAKYFLLYVRPHSARLCPGTVH